jgi:hypothetical protein
MRPVRRADNLTTFMCRLSRNLGASTSWNPKDLSRPVMGLLNLYLYPSTGLQCFTTHNATIHIVTHLKTIRTVFSVIQLGYCALQTQIGTAVTQLLAELL